MDYGQQQTQAGQAAQTAQPFFTAGQGTADPNQNTFNPENNLDLSGFGASWGVTPERDSRSIGNRAISSSAEPVFSASSEAPQTVITPNYAPTMPPAAETASRAGFYAPNMAPATPELGQIVTLTPPASSPSAPEYAMPDLHVDQKSDRIAPAAIREVKQAEAALSQTGDIGAFYDQIRSMSDLYLSNSYNRKRAA